MSSSGVTILLDTRELAATVATDTAGYYLFTKLKQAGLERDQFDIIGVEPFVFGPDAKPIDLGDARVVLALGPTAFRRIMALDVMDPVLKADYHAYIHWSHRYKVWVVAADSPRFIMAGQHHLSPLLQFAATRAVEVAAEGFAYAEPAYLLDPPADVFAGWVRAYQHQLASGLDTYLSVDIETPWKAKKGEEQLAREDEDDYIILRCSFAWEPGSAVSIPWQAPYMASLERLFGDDRNRLVTWNGGAYDLPRLRNQLTVNGEHHDAMLAWHVLNSALDKRLGFVAPFYAKDARMWKHLASVAPAYYNAQDADMALRIYLGVRSDLERAGQIEVYNRHIIELHKVTDAMSAAGVLRDETMRADAEAQLTALLIATEKEMSDALPQEIQEYKVFVRTPASTEGLVQVTRTVAVKHCSACGLVGPTKPHFTRKTILRPIASCHTDADICRDNEKVPNPCQGAVVVTTQEPVVKWARPLEWKASSKGMKAYQAALRHSAVVSRQKGGVTYDEDAIEKLKRKYPKDPLYPLLLTHRGYQKLRGTYFGITQPDGTIKGGLTIGRDGRIHAEFTDNPSTLRMACQNPNMQNLPRQTDDPLTNMVRNQVVAGKGMILLERDYSAIEAVLSAWDARWPDGIRLAKLGIHSYLASFVLKRAVDLTWSDADLKAAFKEIKGSKDAEVNRIYNACKRCVHLSNYGGTPRKMVQAEPETFKDVKYATWLQETYFEVAGPIRKWQKATQLEAHTNGYLRNVWGYIHRFTHVFRNVKEAGEWVRKPGDQANEALAFLPQSNAAGIIKEAMLRLYSRHETRPWLRLQVHDSLVLEVPQGAVDEVDQVLREEMERPVMQLPLPASYGMGEALMIGTDGKRGTHWGDCH